MTQVLRSAALALLTIVAVVFVSSRADAQLNLVYLESNVGSVSGQNSIYGFSNDGAGHLTALPGSPYLTGGTGVYDPGGLSGSFDADGQIIINRAATLLFAVNGNSNTISVFNINSDGSLTSIAGSPFPSGGSEPVSLSLDETVGGGKILLAVTNKASDPNQADGLPNYTTFFVDSAGKLTPTGQTVNLAAGSSPSQVILQPSGHLMITDDFMAGTISSYRYNSFGAMTFLGSVSPKIVGNFLGLALHPTQPFIYAATPSVVQGGNYMSAYKYSTKTGALAFQKFVTNQGLATCWISVNQAGTRFYDSETVSNTVSVYDITNPAQPVFQQQVTLPTGGTPVNLKVDPTQHFVYVLQDKGVKQTSSSVQARLVVETINADGSLSRNNAAALITLPTGETPVGLAVTLK